MKKVFRKERVLATMIKGYMVRSNGSREWSIECSKSVTSGHLHKSVGVRW